MTHSLVTKILSLAAVVTLLALAALVAIPKSAGGKLGPEAVRVGAALAFGARSVTAAACRKYRAVCMDILPVSRVVRMIRAAFGFALLQCNMLYCTAVVC